MVPYYPFDLPEDCQQAVEVIYQVDMPRFVSFDSNGDLYIAIWAHPEIVIAAMVAPPGAPLPPAPHARELVCS